MPGINVKTTPQPATTINNNDQPCVFVAGEKKKKTETTLMCVPEIRGYVCVHAHHIIGLLTAAISHDCRFPNPNGGCVPSTMDRVY